MRLLGVGAGVRVGWGSGQGCEGEGGKEPSCAVQCSGGKERGPANYKTLF